MEKKTFLPNTEVTASPETGAIAPPQRSLEGLAAELKNIITKDQSQRRIGPKHTNPETDTATTEK